jgi:hypothetical protein
MAAHRKSSVARATASVSVAGRSAVPQEALHRGAEFNRGLSYELVVRKIRRRPRVAPCRGCSCRSNDFRCYSGRSLRATAVFDLRRLRPNILIGGVQGLDERDWPGAELHIGEAIVRVDSLRGRCPMTTVDPDTLDRDPEVLRDIGRRFGGRLALNADVGTRRNGQRRRRREAGSRGRMMNRSHLVEAMGAKR